MSQNPSSTSSLCSLQKSNPNFPSNNKIPLSKQPITTIEPESPKEDQTNSSITFKRKGARKNGMIHSNTSEPFIPFETFEIIEEELESSKYSELKFSRYDSIASSIKKSTRRADLTSHRSINPLRYAISLRKSESCLASQPKIPTILSFICREEISENSNFRSESELPRISEKEYRERSIGSSRVKEDELARRKEHKLISSLNSFKSDS